jgi:ketosteroid isomerase-like protein
MPRPNILLVQSLYAALEKNDFAAVLLLVSDDITMRQCQCLPWGGLFFGPRGLIRFWRGMAAHIQSTVVIDHFIDADVQLAVIGRTTGHVLQGGAAFDIRSCHVFSVKDERINRIQFLIDTTAMLRALLPVSAATFEV